MIIPGKSLPRFFKGLINRSLQLQPCGLDLTLKRVLKPLSAGRLDLDNSQRRTPSTSVIPFQPSKSSPNNRQLDSLHLEPGVYLIEFNETVEVPLNKMGVLFPRSSLWRSCATFTAGVVDSGYRGVLGGQLSVLNPFGLDLVRDARMVQIVFGEMAGPVEGYRGEYQGTASLHRGAWQ
jgi:dUTP pyrophosphatase